VGGESPRPDAARPSAEEELRRVLPVVRELAAAGAVVTVDTMRAEDAARARNDLREAPTSTGRPTRHQ